MGWWQIIARLRGWKRAYDVETGALVVWHPRLGVHYTGKGAWHLAATY